MRMGLIEWVDLLRWRNRGVVNLHLCLRLLRLNSRFLGRAWRGWGVWFRGACWERLRCTFSFDGEVEAAGYFSFLLEHMLYENCVLFLMGLWNGTVGFSNMFARRMIADSDRRYRRVNTLYPALLDADFPRMMCELVRTKSYTVGEMLIALRSSE